jgi:hypothetical protein
LNFYNPGNCFVDLPGFGDVSVSLPFVCGEIEGTLDVTYAAFDDDADGKLLLADYMENLQLCQSVKEGTIVA